MPVGDEMSITSNHHSEHMERLAKKVGPVYFLINRNDERISSCIRWNDIFTIEEMKHAELWYSKCLITAKEANLIDM